MSLDTANAWANPNSLTAARQRLEWTTAEVAAEAKHLGEDYRGITQETLESWESGRGSPELRHLEALARIYVCPVGWFFMSEIPPQIDKLDFRGVTEGTKIGAQGRQTLSRFVELAEWAEDVSLQTGQLRVPAIGHANHYDSIEETAASERRRLGFTAEVREQWNSGEAAFGWWRRAIEDLGVFCFMMRLPTSQVRGASLWGGHGGAFLLVNSEDAESATGRMFTLLHEYGHLVLRAGSVCDFRGSSEGAALEVFANRLAARILLGHDELMARLGDLDVAAFRPSWGDSLLDRLREPFRVSRDVVAIYLEELGLAPEGHYAAKRQLWAKRRVFARGTTHRARLKLPSMRLRRVGSTLARVLSSPEGREAISPLDLAEMLDVKVERLTDVLGAFRESTDAV